MSKMDIAALNANYQAAESVDQEVFAEMRSNILLYTGDHYNKRLSSNIRHIRESKDLNKEQKLRLTKNHVQFQCDVLSNYIVAPNPGVGFSPKNEKELQDQKAAQLHHAVWRDAVEKYGMPLRIWRWADNFVQLGEVICKLYFDPNKGRVKAYNQKVTEDGQPIFLYGEQEVLDAVDPMTGQPLPPAQDMESPVFSGEFVFEDVLGFNLLRPDDCKLMDEAKWLGIRKMTNAVELANQFPGKENFIQSGMDETYMVFDASRTQYSRGDKNDVLVCEYYYRPSSEYPEGYFYITTKAGILAEGPLPGGIFPIVYMSYREIATHPRGRSPIKTMRPYQAEHNRGMSKIAEHQITLGDDKILHQHGTKITSGVSLPGIRTASYTGAKPEIMEGRDGSQYLPSAQQNLAEWYQVLGMKELMDEDPAQLDPWAMLMRSAKLKKKFQKPIARFEIFLVNIVKTYLSLAKLHMPDDTLIYAIGSTEVVNIEEFRTTNDLCYEIKVEPQSEDFDSKFGKQLRINHILQYVGPNMDKSDIGKLIRQMPDANFDESFSDFTLDYDSAVNMMLALDRGQKPPINKYDNHVYMIRMLTARVRKSDFAMMDEQVKANYAMAIQTYEQFEAMNQMAIMQAKEGYIPTGGTLVTCDVYVPKADDPTKSEKLKLPEDALGWLAQRIEAQRSGMMPLSSLPQGAQAEMAEKVSSGLGAGSPPAGPMPGMNRMGMGSG